ncbi:MAG TPA: putative lipid II flippase FtsW [Blastocatellia bacterium]|nr:putative lipid II flippase FtsW [Blastocatellia bacterium]
MKLDRIDWIMFLLAAGLAVFGTMMVYSASAMIAQRETAGASQFTYFYKQAGFTIAGIVIMFVASRVDYRRLNSFPIVLLGLLVTVAFLIAVFGFPAINGAQRWIRFGGLSLQPSEIAKITVPVFLAWFLVRNADRVGELKATLLPMLLVVGLVSGLIFVEPDLGTTLVICAIFAAVYFAAGAKLIHVAGVGGVFVTGVAAALYFAPWRMRRLGAFLDPCDPENAAGAGYQVCQSLYAIGSGGVLGEGFARGQQKLFYLPYPHSDFIFSVVGEEFGLVGTLAIVAAFAVLLWRGTRAALNAPDRFGTLLGIGLITGITVQALFNISVVISILPAKGIPLPFISYGGSSVLVTLAAVGVLLSIAAVDEEDPAERPAASGVRRKKARSGLK